MGLKLRFSLFFAFLLLCVLSGFSVLVYLEVRANLFTTAEQTLLGHLEHDSRHLDHGHQGLHADAEPSAKSHIYLRIWKGGVLIEDSFPKKDVHFSGGWGNQGDKIVHRWIENRNGQQYQVLGYYDLTATLAYLAALRRTLALGCLIALLLVVPLGLLASKTLLSPFRELAGAASRLSAKRLSFRFPEPKYSDEHGLLVKTFNSLLSRLEESFGHTARFATNASHELRTPLAVIIAHADMVLRKPREAHELQAALNKVFDQAIQLRSITHRLLMLADVEREETHKSATSIQVRRTVQEALSTLSYTHGESDRTVEIPEEKEEIQVLGNESLLFSIISNLLENALKYAASKVRVSFAKQSSGLMIEIEDDGPGIPEEEKEQVFEPFYRGRAQAASSKKGHGLGLSIVKASVQASRGSISLGKSRLGGLLVRIVIPEPA